MDVKCHISKVSIYKDTGLVRQKTESFYMSNSQAINDLMPFASL